MDIICAHLTRTNTCIGHKNVASCVECIYERKEEEEGVLGENSSEWKNDSLFIYTTYTCI